MRILLINGAPIAMTSFLALAYQHADKLITTALIGTDGTGQLTAGFVIVFGVIELLSTTVLVAVFPLMSRTYGSGQRELFELMLEKLSFFNLMLSLPIAIYTSLLAVPLAAWLFGAGLHADGDRAANPDLVHRRDDGRQCVFTGAPDQKPPAPHPGDPQRQAGAEYRAQPGCCCAHRRARSSRRQPDRRE